MLHNTHDYKQYTLNFVFEAKINKLANYNQSQMHCMYGISWGNFNTYNLGRLFDQMSLDLMWVTDLNCTDP